MSKTHKPGANLSSEEKRKLLAQLLQKKVSKSHFFPLSFAQQRLWFLEQLQPGISAYNIPAALHLTGLLNIAALEQSLNEIVRRHEVLRTTFTAIKGQPFQCIAPTLTLTLPLVDLRALPPDEREVEVLRRVKEEALQSFDLASGPLLRSSLLKLDTAEHVLLFAMHHIISDYWSMRVLIRELAAIYQAFSCGKPSPLPELVIQYADFTVWQRKWLQQEARSTQLAYWKRQLGNHLPVLQLPTDRPRPVVQTFRGTTQSFSLSTELSEALKALSRREGVTLFMTLLAAFKTLLYRYTSQNEIIIGSTIANRNRPEIEDLIGLFVNNLVFRTYLGGNPSFQELLGQVRECTLSAYAHQDLPFDYLVEELQPERNLSHNPLFQVMFILHNTPTENLDLPGLTLSYLKPENQTARFDLSLDMYETSPGLTGVFEYNTDLFDAATINRMVEYFCTLLSSIVTNPEQRLSDLPLLTASVAQQLLVEWNDTQTEYPSSKCIHELIADQAERTPEAIAVVFEDKQLTYQELNARANKIAHYLQTLGVAPEVLVGICVERSLEMVVGLLGILKAGGAYVPLDPAYPKERLAFMLLDSQIGVLLTTQKLVAALPEHQALVVRLDADWQEIAAYSDRHPTSLATPENLAYTIYTSGSTGLPKGVQIVHGAVVNFLSAMRLTPGLTQEDILVSVTTLSFDIAGLELYLPLIVGARLVVLSREVAASGSKLLETLVSSGATVMQATPATWRLLVAAGWQGNRQLKIICGGEALDRVLAEQLLLRGNELWNVYGPTETTIWSAGHKVEITELTSFQAGVVAIGRPIANTQFYILDPHQQPVPVGVAGELHIGGIGLARGYLNRSELQADKFIPNPFSDQPASRLYKTGDLVCYRPDGTLEYLGRIDNQVKLRGFRIELGEIEAALAQHPVVRETVVVVREDEPGEQRLVAYVVAIAKPATSEAPPAAPAPPPPPALFAELRRFLKDKLPNYMVPSVFVQLDALPLTPNGKVDRRALPAPDKIQLQPHTTFVAPNTPVEEILAAIWESVLSLEQIGIHDNFFELGGHSLLATRVISQLRKVFQVELPLLRLFESPTVAGLAKEIETATSVGLGLEAPPIERISRSRELPLSFAQQRLWFLAQLEPESAFYNIPAAVRLKGALNIAILEQSLNEILRRHEVLHTSFKIEEGRPLQVISPVTPLLLPVIDLSELPPAQQEAEVRQLALFEAQQPFALDTSPLLRVKLLCLGRQEYVALFTMHHIVSDVWSMSVFVRELAALYQAFCNEPSLQQATLTPLPELPIQYVDFAAWQRQWLQGAVLEAQLAYWRQHLEGAPTVLELPTDRMRPAVQTFRGATCAFQLAPDRSVALKTLSQQEGSTLFMTLLAAFKTLLHRYTDSEDIVVGSPIANRNRAETEGLMGFFVNTLALRTDMSGNPSFRELLRRVREVALGAYAHQDLPFEQLVEELQPQRDLSHTPLFQVMFVLQNAPMKLLELSGLTWSPLESESGTAKFDLTLYMAETTEGLVGTFEYNTELFEADTIHRMAGHFQTLLAGILANPKQHLNELPLLTAAERQLLMEWNNAQTEYPQDRCLHELFEAQVERTPNAIAVVFEQQQLTYWELNAKANKIAHYLRKLGVDPEVLVGVCVERSLYMVVGLLGILKAGGAYVPLDPAYPKDRLAFMLSDAQVPVLLTQQKLVPELPENGAHTVCLDTDWERIEKENETNPVTGVEPDNLAYVIYTSGSTGIPKGVAIEHRSTVALTSWAQGVFKSDRLSGVLASTSICFDLSVFELFVPLSWGGKVILAENALHLPRLSAAGEVTLINTVPSALVELLRVNGIPDGVRTVNLAGEPLPNLLVRQIYQQETIEQVFNLYGPSEDTTYSTFALCVPRQSASKSPPIGRPVANTQVYILDRNLQPIPIGVPGELYVGGAGLARGYLNRPELTAERFIPNPFSSDRLYKTGDLARYLPDGNIEYLGRLDNQVKVRGFRIELGEIEAVLSQHPNVFQTVVSDREDHIGYQRLVAYIVPEPQQIPNAKDLRRFLKEKLPEYMVPSAFVMLEALPLTPNGKIDRRLLPEIDTTKPDLAAAFVAPCTPEEKLLAKIWSELLGIEQVGIDDNFFELGGDSILVLQLIARANQAGLQLIPKHLFQYQTIAELAAVVGTSGLEAEQGPVTGPLPLTPIQHWFFEENLSDPHHWNQSILLEIRQALDPVKLEQALQQLLEHHDALRLRFERTKSGWQQVNASPDQVVPTSICQRCQILNQGQLSRQPLPNYRLV